VLLQPADEVVDLHVLGHPRLHQRLTVHVNRWTTVFSPQPRQAPSPLEKSR
jgi:hypothetical protein